MLARSQKRRPRKFTVNTQTEFNLNNTTRDAVRTSGSKAIGWSKRRNEVVCIATISSWRARRPLLPAERLPLTSASSDRSGPNSLVFTRPDHYVVHRMDDSGASLMIMRCVHKGPPWQFVGPREPRSHNAGDSVRFEHKNRPVAIFA